MVELDSNFCEYLAQAAPIINRNEYRKVLQGINLSKSGITTTDGKQLLNIPCTLDLIVNWINHKTVHDILIPGELICRESIKNI